MTTELPTTPAGTARGGKLWLLAILALLVVAGIWFVAANNRLVALQENVKQAWAQVETVLQRRFDLIPNLVNTVKGYAEHEQGVLEEVTRLRSQWGQAKTVDEKAAAASALKARCRGCCSWPRTIPISRPIRISATCRSNSPGRRIASRSNGAGTTKSSATYNTAVRQFPTSIVASLRGFTTDSAYFEAAPKRKQLRRSISRNRRRQREPGAWASLKIGQFLWPDRHAQRVDHDDHVDHFLHDRPGHRRQVAGRGEQHADDARRHAADRALQRDPPHPLADVQELVDLRQRAVHHHDVGRLGRDVAVLAEGDADRRGRQGRRVVDAVADEDRVGPRRLGPHDLELLLRALAAEHFGNADQVGQVLHFRLAGRRRPASRGRCDAAARRWRMNGRPSRRGRSRKRYVAA